VEDSSVVDREVGESGIDERAGRSPGEPWEWLSRADMRAVHTEADLLAVLTRTGRIVSVSATVGSLLGVDAEDLHDVPIWSTLVPQDVPTVRNVARRLALGRQLRDTLRLHHRNGAAVWLDVAAKCLEPPAGEPVVLVSAREVTHDVLALQQLAESEQRWRLTFDHSPIGAALIDRSGEILLANPSLGRILGYRTDELTQRTLSDISHPDDAEIDAARWTELLAGTLPSYAVEKRFVASDGRLLWGQLTVAAVRSEDRLPHEAIAQLQDISSHREAQLELANRALHDPLTRLPNRFLVRQWLTSALEEHLGRGVGVLYCDLDRFKFVNDSLGHAAGDDLLVEVATRLRGALRPEDLVGRVGGDEFVVVCERMSGNDDLVQVAARLAASLDEPISVGGHLHTVTISIGAAIGGSTESSDELLMQADMALLRAKRLGRARAEVFDPAVDRIATRGDLELEEQLRASIGSGELRAFYQPIVRLRDHVVAGHESLLRWKHGERGLLAPEGFLQLAESSGLIRAMDWWILTKACRDTMRRVGGLGADDSWISVNASASQLGRPGFAGLVRESLDRSGLLPGRLHVEITETALLHASDAVVAELVELRRLGVGIALDDFGTGYSSLSLLRDLPVSMVKIDRSFVSPTRGGDSAHAIIRAVASMCRDLGLPTVAEGVETQEQADRVAELGCTHAQGYLFGRPVALDSAAGPWMHDVSDKGTLRKTESDTSTRGRR
jgi:diguanylate cyclase (GGDEF)-like protein/PAS domain S-box-containing protein